MAEIRSARSLVGLEESLRAGTCYVPRTYSELRSLRRRVPGGSVCEPARGLFAPAASWRSLEAEARVLALTRGLVEVHPSWIFCNATAALIHGLEVPRPALRNIHVQAPGHHGGGPDAFLTFHAYREMEGAVVNGSPVSAFKRTVADCLMTQPFSMALPIADSALRLTHMDARELVALVGSEGRNRKGVRRALRLAAYADARSENGGESRVRAFLIERGYPLPELQVELPDPTDSTRVFRVDFYWVLPDGRVVIGEFDGMGKYRGEAPGGGLDVRQVVHERQRESRLTLLGFPVLRFTFGDLVHPERLEALLASAGIHPDASRVPDWAGL